MRQIGTLAQEKNAQKLADYLLTRKIATRLEKEGDGWLIWVCDEDRLPQAKQELDEFLRNPDDPRYLNAALAAESLRREEVREEKKYRKNLIDVRQRWGEPSLRNYPLTLSLIVISVLVALFSQMGSEENTLRIWLSIAPWDPASKMYQLGLPDILHGQVWRLVTPIFVHFSIWHLFFNMLWLYDLGRMIEFRRGTWRLALIVFVIAAASNLGQYWATDPNFGGMSGVVFGLFGYVWMKSRFDPGAGLYMHPNNVILMLVWFVVCTTGAVGPIANWAHGVGLVVGMVIGLASAGWRELRRRE